MLNAVFLWRQASSSYFTVYQLMVESQRRSPSVMGRRLEDNSASAGFTGNERSWRQTVNRCWPCVQHKGCEITEHGPGPPRSRLCICQCACFHCVCVQTWRLTVRDRVRLKSFEIPAFLWGILSVIYLSWALWACTLNYRAELKDAVSDWHDIQRFIYVFKEKLLSIIYLCSEFRFLYEVSSAHVFMFTFFFLETTTTTTTKNLKSQNERNKGIKGICVNVQESIPGTKPESYMWQLQYKHLFCHIFLDFWTHCLE